MIQCEMDKYDEEVDNQVLLCRRNSRFKCVSLVTHSVKLSPHIAVSLCIVH